MAPRTPRVHRSAQNRVQVQYQRSESVFADAAKFPEDEVELLPEKDSPEENAVRAAKGSTSQRSSFRGPFSADSLERAINRSIRRRRFVMGPIEKLLLLW